MKRECSGKHPPSGDESRLVETVDGPIAKLTEWGKSQGSYPDHCPASWSAHYSLYVKGQFISDTSTPEHARLLRDIALTLNAVHENGSGQGQLV